MEKSIGACGADRCTSPSAEDSLLSVPPHPLGIRPAGNAYTAVENLKSSAGLFSTLPDELIVQILESLSHRPLLILGFTCKALYAFCRFDDLWKTLFIEYVSILFCSALDTDGHGFDLICIHVLNYQQAMCVFALAFVIYELLIQMLFGILHVVNLCLMLLLYIISFFIPKVTVNEFP